MTVVGGVALSRRWHLGRWLSGYGGGPFGEVDHVERTGDTNAVWNKGDTVGDGADR
jgi:hypothetical protein